MKRAPKDQDLLKILKEMESLQSHYPEELRSARRAAFLEQVARSAHSEEEQPVIQDQDVLNHLGTLRSVPAQYPPRLLAARRAAFVRQIAWLNFVNLCTTVWQAIQKRIPVPAFTSRIPAGRSVPASLVTAGLALAVFLGYLFYGNQAALTPVSLDRPGTVHSGRILTTDTREVRIICKSGAEPPLCLVGEYQRDVKLTYQGNGTARPAVAKDAASSLGQFYKAAYVNDGMFGPGASWISNSRNSWIKIDLGKATQINTVTFGRDRLGKLTGHNPGRFVVSLALSDNIYADGDHSNDAQEYQLVYDSKKTGFNGKISGAETVIAQFTPRMARYIKITFENKGTAIDEVEAFMARPSASSSLPGRSSRDKESDDSIPSLVTSTSLPLPTATPLPVDTATTVPTATLLPSATATFLPSATANPTNTNVPTSTAIPTNTSIPTNTLPPEPSNTPLPPPTDTPVPSDTDTPAPTESTQSAIPSRTGYYDYLTNVPVIP